MEEAKRLERAAKIKEENRIRRGIILAVRNQAGTGFTYGGGSTSRSSAGGSDAGSRGDAARASARDSLGGGNTAREGGRSRAADDGASAEGGFFVTQQPGE